MAQSLHWIPDTLYNYALSAVVNSYNVYKKDFKLFHGNLIFDIYYKLYKEGHLTKLNKELENLSNFGKVLDVFDKRCLLHNCFQALEDNDYKIALHLAASYAEECTKCVHSSSLSYKTVKLGFALGSFLCDAGWFPESEVVFRSCVILCYAQSPVNISLVLKCLQRVLRARTNYCRFAEARVTVKEMATLFNKIRQEKLDINLSSAFSEISAFYLAQSNYKQPYKWIIEALKELNSSVPVSDLVYILRCASKACILKKQFKQAEWLIKQALILSRDFVSSNILMMADVLIDYGYYLLHKDFTAHSVQVYEKALNIRTKVLGGRNLLVAQAREEFAYALYVNEYNSGNFRDARAHAKKALATKQMLLGDDHLLLFPAQRVNALILEEIAIDVYDKPSQEKLFLESEELHLSALQITLKYLGENNIQTGKHYNNIGRLYQSMRKFKEAEKMHLKGLAMKQLILGPDDYEIATSLGHLASLYNYDMELYEEAEDLYWKSIKIGLQHFGKSYSGLEFDYRGLLRVYSVRSDWTLVEKVSSELHEWKMLRDENQKSDENTSPLTFTLVTVQPEEMFFYFESLDLEKTH